MEECFRGVESTSLYSFFFSDSPLHLSSSAWGMNLPTWQRTYAKWKLSHFPVVAFFNLRGLFWLSISMESPSSSRASLWDKRATSKLFNCYHSEDSWQPPSHSSCSSLFLKCPASIPGWHFQCTLSRDWEYTEQVHLQDYEALPFKWRCESNMSLNKMRR